MNENVIKLDDDNLESVLSSLKKNSKEMGKFTENYHPLLDGERYLTDRELSEKLKLSRRTLQDYRNNKIIPYIIFGGKVLYKESDIQKLLEECYFKAIR